MSRADYDAKVDAARARLAASGRGGPLVVATLAARKRDPHIGTRVSDGWFTIVRAVPRPNGTHDVTVLAAPMRGTDVVEALKRFANGGEL